MLKKTIKYTDYNDNDCTEDFYFNLSVSELTQYGLQTEEGDISKAMIKAAKDKDQSKLLKLVLDLIRMSYGVKSEDGKRFIKTKEATDAFMESPAFDELFLDLASNPDSASSFVKGLLPKNVVEKIEAIPEEEIAKMRAQIEAEVSK